MGVSTRRLRLFTPAHHTSLQASYPFTGHGSRASSTSALGTSQLPKRWLSLASSLLAQRSTPVPGTSQWLYSPSEHMQSIRSFLAGSLQLVDRLRNERPVRWLS